MGTFLSSYKGTFSKSSDISFFSPTTPSGSVVVFTKRFSKKEKEVMMKMGIVGAENSHSWSMASEMNVANAVPGFKVTHIWGETKEFASAAAERGKIPNIVKKVGDLIGQVDCVMIDHRNGKYHFAAAKPLLKAKLPVFIDKPITVSVAEGRKLMAFRKQCRAPITTMSSVPHQACVKNFKKELKKIGEVRTVHMSGPGDANSKYGGIFFYGIHQTDLMVELFGTDIVDATAVKHESRFSGIIRYKGGLTVTINMAAVDGFAISAVGSKGGFYAPVVYDKHMGLPVARIITKMFRSRKEPFSEARMLAPIAALEAMDRSIRTGRTVPAARV